MFFATYQANLKKKPLLLQIPIEADVRPYLVSSNDGWVWVSKSGSPYARVALRNIPEGGLSELAREAIAEIARTSKECQWESVHPLTVEGVTRAVAHPLGYGYEVIPLVSPDIDLASLHLDPLKVEVADWLPPKTVLVVPIDRAESAQAMLVGDKVAAILLDPSRSFGIAQG